MPYHQLAAMMHETPASRFFAALNYTSLDLHPQHVCLLARGCSMVGCRGSSSLLFAAGATHPYGIGS
eukprot:scaffold398044_cov19-Prasinocladus_malaysianus.AAC.1